MRYVHTFGLYREVNSVFIPFLIQNPTGVKFGVMPCQISNSQSSLLLYSTGFPTVHPLINGTISSFPLLDTFSLSPFLFSFFLYKAKRLRRALYYFACGGKTSSKKKLKKLQREKGNRISYSSIQFDQPLSG